MRLQPSKREKAGVFHILCKTYFELRLLERIVSSGLHIGKGKGEVFPSMARCGPEGG